MSKTEDMQRFLDNMIKSYPGVHNSRYWSEIHPFIKELAGGRCLDLGCGPGLLLLDIFNKYQSKSLTGIDLSPLMLDKAREYLSEVDGKSEINLIQQHLQEDMNLPLNNDLIFISRVLRSFEQPLLFLSNIKQSLVDNGLLIILDWDQQSLPVYDEWFSQNAIFEDREIRDVVRLHRNFSRYSLEDWEFLLRNTGFVIKFTFQLNPVHLVIIAGKL